MILKFVTIEPDASCLTQFVSHAANLVTEDNGPLVTLKSQYIVFIFLTSFK